MTALRLREAEDAKCNRNGSENAQVKVATIQSSPILHYRLDFIASATLL
jgi:hypothetical protein